MAFILGSLLWAAVSVFSGIVILNYAMLLWEKRRVDDLASQIKPSEKDILHKSSVSRELTSFDFRDLSKSAPARLAQDVYERTILHINQQNYPTWVQNILNFLDDLRRNTWKTLRRTFNYLVSLSKPGNVEESDSTVSPVEVQEVAEVVERVKEKNLEKQQAIPALTHTVQPNSNPLVMPTKETQDKQPPSATLNLAAGNKPGSKNNSNFEKLENRLLDKLKQSGLNNYDIWLELGELYIKYNERDKATEVLALVLKHTLDEKQKELARNRLIGL